ncbi:MAG: hypothetical protein A2157_08800 [Deltaproteobacteria bacterium RBG_16_47_11]|nr:MAG: hypothetical protein A2157_08800 [Deltaproteobacteria bacterium RBG_16_47_11]
MAGVVESVAPEFGEALLVEKVVTKELKGAIKYNEISKSLGRPAPVPSIFMEGELVYEQTPTQEELRECLHRWLQKPA